MGRLPISDCDICQNLSSHNYADLRSASIPSHLAVLVGTDPSLRLAREFVECPHCGCLYLYTYDCGFGENDLTLRRATPNEAGRETDVTGCRQDLAGAHADTRAYAAQCLVEYYLQVGEIAEAQSLVTHSDEAIRSAAESAKRFFLYQQKLGWP